MRFFGNKTRRACKHPSAAIAQERKQKWCKPIPDDNNSEKHLSAADEGTTKGTRSAIICASCAFCGFFPYPLSSRMTCSRDAKSATETGMRPYFDRSKISSALVRIDLRFGSDNPNIHSRQ